MSSTDAEVTSAMREQSLVAASWTNRKASAAAPISAPLPVTVNTPLVKLAPPANPTAPTSRVIQGPGTKSVGDTLACPELALSPPRFSADTT